MKCDGEKGRSTNSEDSTKRRLQCPTAPKVLDLAVPRDAQFVMASLVSSGTTRGERRFVPRSASIASELAGIVTAIGWAGFKSPSTSCPRTARGLYDGPDLTTRQGIFRDGTDFAPRCQTMTDSAIAGQLKALADDYQRRAEKASHVDRMEEFPDCTERFRDWV